MLDLKTQYHHIKDDIDKAILDCVESVEYINGKAVKEFAENLATYLDVKHVIPCANGTDALQMAMMALDLKEGDEIIIPAFTYAAPVEAACLLKLKPVLVDVDANTFNISVDKIEKAITPKTKAIIAVHLFGQACDMDAIMQIAAKHNLFVIEDNAQAIGCNVKYSNKKVKTGTLGHINCTSFFPSKNLGCFGDGGALTTNDSQLAEKAKMIANHGQRIKYTHEVIGINSRLDSIQAAILDEKLKHLDSYISKRQQAAVMYDEYLKSVEGIKIPVRSSNSEHVFHQYTLKVKSGKRDELRNYLQGKNIPSMIYYPFPIQQQQAYKNLVQCSDNLTETENLCNSVLSLPMHTELDEGQIAYISQAVKSFAVEVNSFGNQ